MSRFCQTCCRQCDCPRPLHTGEAKVLVAFTLKELLELLDDVSNYQVSLRLERAKDLLT